MPYPLWIERQAEESFYFRAELAKAEKLLRNLEWCIVSDGPEYIRCPSCGMWDYARTLPQNRTHKMGCDIADFLERHKEDA